MYMVTRAPEGTIHTGRPPSVRAKPQQHSPSNRQPTVAAQDDHG
jgi:hypothetical protein